MNAPCRLLPLIAAAVVLAGCATLPPRPSGSDALLVGRVALTVTHGAYYGEPAVDGSHVAGIYVSVRNLTTGKTYHAESYSPDGRFFFPSLAPGRYALTKLFYYDGFYNQSAKPVFTAILDLPFVVAARAVNNLGELDWRDSGGISPDVHAGAGYAAVAKSFAGPLAASRWAALPRVDVRLEAPSK